MGYAPLAVEVDPSTRNGPAPVPRLHTEDPIVHCQMDLLELKILETLPAMNKIVQVIFLRCPLPEEERGMSEAESPVDIICTGSWEGII